MSVAFAVRSGSYAELAVLEHLRVPDDDLVTDGADHGAAAGPSRPGSGRSRRAGGRTASARPSTAGSTSVDPHRRAVRCDEDRQVGVEDVDGVGSPSRLTARSVRWPS